MDIILDYESGRISLSKAYKILGESRNDLDEDIYNEIHDKLNEYFYEDILSNDELNGNMMMINEIYEASLLASSSSCRDVTRENVYEEHFLIDNEA